MTLKYYTNENDILDEICWKYYFQSNLKTSMMQQESTSYNEISNMSDFLEMPLKVANPEMLPYAISKVLDANPSLSFYGAFLPSGICIKLPNLNLANTKKESVNLWE